MDWNAAYKRERRATWDEIAQAIHDTVTVADIVRTYLPEYTPRHNRIPCPIHNGKDYNFSYTQSGYKCFVCGASGDVIALVKEVCELSTRADAMKRINADLRLGLPIGCEITQADENAIRERQKAARERERVRQEWEDGYNALWDEWCRLDRQRMCCPPGTKEYADTVEALTRVGYDIDCYPQEPR